MTAPRSPESKWAFMALFFAMLSLLAAEEVDVLGTSFAKPSHDAGPVPVKDHRQLQGLELEIEGTGGFIFYSPSPFPSPSPSPDETPNPYAPAPPPPPPPVIISLEIEGTYAEINTPAVLGPIAQKLADAANVPVSAVTMTVIDPNAARRLEESGRRLQDTVTVEGAIDVPEGTDPETVVSDLNEELGDAAAASAYLGVPVASLNIILAAPPSAPPMSPPSPPPTSSSSIGVIIGAAVGGVVFVIIVAAAIMYMMKKNKKSVKVGDSNSGAAAAAGGGYSGGGASAQGSSASS